MMANENDEITGVSSSEGKELEQTRRQLETDQGHPRADTEPVHAPGLSDRAYEPPEAEEAPAAQPQTTEQPEPQRGVPPAALTEERDRRRQSEQELSSLREKTARMEERFQMLQTTIQEGQQQRLQQAQEQAAPNPEEDLQGYVTWMRDQYEKQRATDQQKLQSLEQNQAYENEVRSVKERAMADARSFSATAQDFSPAYEWLRNQQYAELTAQGYAPQDAATILDRQELNFLADHQRAGRNSAEAFYMAAKARGWQAPQPNGQNGATQHAQPQYQQQQPMPQYQAPQQQPGRPDLTNMQAGMLESRSFDEAGGTGQGIPESLDAIANMSDAEFAQRHEQVRAMMRKSMR